MSSKKAGKWSDEKIETILEQLNEAIARSGRRITMILIAHDAKDPILVSVEGVLKEGDGSGSYNPLTLFLDAQHDYDAKIGHAELGLKPFWKSK
ncbi:MAG: hypothetical protein ABIE68_04840 [bacterium]